MVTFKGLIRSHGPKGNRCPGSSLLPSSASSGASSEAREADGVMPPSTCSVPCGSDVQGSYSSWSLPISGRKVIKRIPKGSPSTALAKFSIILEEVVSENSVALWRHLLEFSSRCLGPLLMVVVVDH
uniref:Uncharacterized protein n=1 Tax=Amphimedon queenslandica TaxID=400682 RepID=A0A1X7UKM8_AMPQE